MPLTPFGRALRQIRIDRGLLLYDMAEDLHIGVVPLSRIETGKDPVPDGFVDLVRTTYGVSDEELKRLEATRDVLVVPGGDRSGGSVMEGFRARIADPEIVRKVRAAMERYHDRVRATARSDQNAPVRPLQRGE